MEAIATQIDNTSLQDAFLAELAAGLARRGVDKVILMDNVSPVPTGAATPRIGSLLEIEFQDTFFRECGKRWTFVAEVKIRGKLRDLERNRTLYDRTLVRSKRSGRTWFSTEVKRMPNERLVEDGPACRPIEEYCESGNTKLFAEDLAAAARILADRIAEEATGTNVRTR